MRAVAESTPEDPGGWLRLTRLHSDLGDIEGEIAALRDRLRLAGPDSRSSARLVRLLTDSGRSNEAAEHLRAIIQADPQDRDAWMRLARLYAERGDTGSEIDALRDRLRLVGPDAAASARLVKLLTDSGRSNEAAEHLRATAAQNPTSLDGWQRLTRLNSETGDVQGEIAALQDRLRLAGPDAGVSARLVRSLVDSGRTGEAADHLRASAEADPRNSDAWLRLARLYAELNDRDGEISALTRSLRLLPKDQASRARLIRLLMGAGRVTEAAAQLHAGAKADTSNVAIWLRLARLNQRLGDVEGEISALKGRLKATGYDEPTSARLVKLLTDNGRGGEAADHLRALVRADPSNPEGWRRLVQVYVEAGDAEGEVGALRDKLALSGPDPVASARLVSLLLGQGRPEEAAAVLRGPGERDTQDPEGWRLLAAFCRRIGDADGEIEALWRLAKSDGEDPCVELVVQRLRETGREREAVELLQTLAEAAPGDPARWRRLTGLLRELGDCEAEIVALRRMLEQVGLDTEAHLRLVKVLSFVGRKDEATVELAAMARANPADVAGWLRLMRHLQQIGDVEGEMSALRDRLRLAGPDPGSSARLVKLLVDSGRSAEAAAHLQVMAGADPADPHGWNRLARLHAELADRNGEIAALTRLLESSPQDDVARSRLVGLLTDAKRPAEVAVHLRAAAEAGPAKGEAWARLARQYQKLRDLPNEIEALKGRLEAAGPDESTSARLLKLLAESGRLAEAAAHLRELAQSDPANPEAWRRLARLHQQAGDIPGEIRALEDKLALAGRDGETTARLAKLLVDSGRAAEAKVQVRKLAEADPTNVAGWRRLVRLLADLDDVVGEISALRDRLRAAGPDAETSARLVKLLSDQGRSDEASAHLRSLAEAEPANPEGWSRLARHLQQTGDAEGEIVVLQAKLRLCGPDGPSSARLVTLLSATGRDKEAIAHLRELAEAKPGDVARWRRLTQSLANRGDIEGEVDVWERFLELGVGDGLSARSRLVALLGQVGRGAESVDHWRAIARADPGRRGTWRKFEEAAATYGDQESRKEALEGLLSVHPDDITARRRLAAILITTGERERARVELLRIADPTGATAGFWRSAARRFTERGDLRSAAWAWARVLGLHADDPEAVSARVSIQASVAAADLQPPAHFTLESFLQDDNAAPSVEDEHLRILDMLECWSRRDASEHADRAELADAAALAITGALHVLLGDGSLDDPSVTALRWKRLGELWRDSRMAALMPLSSGRFAEFFRSLIGNDGDIHPLLDQGLPLAAKTPGRMASYQSEVGRRLRRVAGMRRKADLILQSEDFRAPVLICGFPHSGTRLVVDVLKAAGLFQVIDTNSGEWTYVKTINSIVLSPTVVLTDRASALPLNFPGWLTPEQVFDFDSGQAPAAIDPDAIALRLAFAGYAGDRPWGHKDPRNPMTLEAWLAAFPDARVVNVVRNPLDALGTLPPRYVRISERMLRPQDDEAAWGALWAAYLDRTRKALAGISRSCEIRFEDLCADPVGSTESIVRSLQLEGLDAAEAGRVRVEGVKTGVYRQWVERGELAPEQLGVLEDVASRYGFPT